MTMMFFSSVITCIHIILQRMSTCMFPRLLTCDDGVDDDDNVLVICDTHYRDYISMNEYAHDVSKVTHL